MSAPDAHHGIGAAIDESLIDRYLAARRFTEKLCGPLSAEDCSIQSMPDVSPTRWHLAHTTWFFETLVLAEMPDYEVFDPQYGYLFNSYYNTIGAQFPRPQRGLLSRPGLAEVMDYRRYVDEWMERLSSNESVRFTEQLAAVTEMGIHHEQQHQELILTDIKHVLSHNPLAPVYRSGKSRQPLWLPAPGWSDFGEGLRWIGHDGGGFAYDNESPRHRVFLEPFAVSNRLVTCGEYLEFIADSGYARPELWLSDGWRTACERSWTAPLYWIEQDGNWLQFTLSGLREVDPAEPVCHVSYVEADAFARWAGARLPTEAEWEVAAENLPIEGNFVDTLLADGVGIHTSPADEADTGKLSQMFGDVWEWTASPYVAYPGYQPPPGAVGEYNGKFMCNQFVLRGGSCATSSSHIRRTYRNFFPADARWQFSGLRLAR
jgi:ergothioneine biosynthesis protein EgtB